MQNLVGLRLPLELILRVIDTLRPSDRAVIDPEGSSLTQCILACTLVCRATYTVSLRILYQHCLWVDTDERLRLLLISLDAQLSPLRCKNSTLPYVDVAACLQNLYLAPFRRSLDDLPTAHWTFELLASMRHSLRSLVINMPLHRLLPEDDHLDVLPKLRAAFEELTVLEEVTSLKDWLFLFTRQDHTASAIPEVPVWGGWLSLKHLALHHINVFDPAYRHLSKLTQLESLVLTDPLAEDESSWLIFLSNLTQNPLTVFEISNILRDDSAFCNLARRGREAYRNSPEQQIELIPITLPATCLCGRHTTTEMLRQWVRNGALQGYLWKAQSISWYLPHNALKDPMFDCYNNTFVGVGDLP